MNNERSEDELFGDVIECKHICQGKSGEADMKPSVDQLEANDEILGSPDFQMFVDLVFDADEIEIEDALEIDQVNPFDEQADGKPCSNNSNGASLKQEAVSTANFQELIDNMCISINEYAPENQSQIDQVNPNDKRPGKQKEIDNEKPSNAASVKLNEVSTADFQALIDGMFCSNSSNGAIAKQKEVSTENFQGLVDGMCRTISEGDGEDNEGLKAIDVVNSRIRNGMLEYLVKQKNSKRTKYVWLAFMDLECHDLVAEYEEPRKPVNKRYTFGFARGLKPAKILGVTDAGGSLMYLMEWEGFDRPDLVLEDETNLKCPNLVLEYLEEANQNI